MALPTLNDPNVTKADSGNLIGDIKGSLLEIANDLNISKKEMKLTTKESNDVENILASIQLNQQRYGEKNDINFQKLAEGMSFLNQSQIDLLEEINTSIKSLNNVSKGYFQDTIDMAEESRKSEQKLLRREAREGTTGFTEPQKLLEAPSTPATGGALVPRTGSTALTTTTQQQKPKNAKTSGFLGFLKQQGTNIAKGILIGSGPALAFGYEYFKEIPDIRKELEKTFKDGAISQEKYEAAKKRLDKDESGAVGGMVGGAAGAVGGALAGAKAGAMIGTFLGPVGTLVGGGIGALIGGLAGGFGGALGGEAIAENMVEQEAADEERYKNRVEVNFPKEVQKRLGERLMIPTYFINPTPNKRGNYHGYPKRNSKSGIIFTNPRSNAYIKFKLDNGKNAESEIEKDIKREQDVAKIKSPVDDTQDTSVTSMKKATVVGGKVVGGDMSQAEYDAIQAEELSDQQLEQKLLDESSFSGQGPSVFDKAVSSVKGFFGLFGGKEAEKNLEEKKKQSAQKQISKVKSEEEKLEEKNLLLDAAIENDNEIKKAEKELGDFEAKNAEAEKKKVFMRRTKGGGYISSSEGFEVFVDPKLQAKQDELDAKLSKAQRRGKAITDEIKRDDLYDATGDIASRRYGRGINRRGSKDPKVIAGMFAEMAQAGEEVSIYVKAGPMTNEEAGAYKRKKTNYSLYRLPAIEEAGMEAGVYDLYTYSITKDYEKFKNKQIEADKKEREEENKISKATAASMGMGTEEGPKAGFFDFVRNKLSRAGMAVKNLAGEGLQALTDLKDDAVTAGLNLFKGSSGDIEGTDRQLVTAEQIIAAQQAGFSPFILDKVKSGEIPFENLTVDDKKLYASVKSEGGKTVTYNNDGSYSVSDGGGTTSYGPDGKAISKTSPEVSGFKITTDLKTGEETASFRRQYDENAFGALNMDISGMKRGEDGKFQLPDFSKGEGSLGLASGPLEVMRGPGGMGASYNLGPIMGRDVTMIAGVGKKANPLGKDGPGLVFRDNLGNDLISLEGDEAVKFLQSASGSNDSFKEKLEKAIEGTMTIDEIDEAQSKKRAEASQAGLEATEKEMRVPDQIGPQNQQSALAGNMKSFIDNASLSAGDTAAGVELMMAKFREAANEALADPELMASMTEEQRNDLKKAAKELNDPANIRKLQQSTQQAMALQRERESGQGIFAPQSNDNSVVNNNTTIEQKPIIAANQNASMNNVNNGNHSFM